MPRVSAERAAWRGTIFALATTILVAVPNTALADREDYILVDDRRVEPSRPVAVLLPQARIASSIELGRIAFPGGGGGILGTLIVDGQNSIPERLAESALARAEERIAPLISSLRGFDIDPLAVAATQAVVTATPWFGAGPPDLYAPARSAGAGESADEGVVVSNNYGVGYFGEPAANKTEAAKTWAQAVAQAQSQFDAAHPGVPERAQIMWRYQMSPDFSQLQVIADVSITRQSASAPLYAQQLISIVKLRRPSYVEEENVQQWAANDGALIRSALTQAFARAGAVLPDILALDEAGFATVTDRKRGDNVTAAGYHGPLLLRDDTGPVFWAEDGDQRLAAFVAVQDAR